jgi:PAS domain-containing protein
VSFCHTVLKETVTQSSGMPDVCVSERNEVLYKLPHHFDTSKRHWFRQPRMCATERFSAGSRFKKSVHIFAKRTSNPDVKAGSHIQHPSPAITHHGLTIATHQRDFNFPNWLLVAPTTYHILHFDTMFQKLLLVRRSPLHISRRCATTTAASGTSWSHSLSFCSPEADYTARPSFSSRAAAPTATATWSQSLSYTHPESDFGTRSASSLAWDSTLNSHESTGPVWSRSLSHGSPESDFVWGRDEPISRSYLLQLLQLQPHIGREATAEMEAWSALLSFASPESDFVSLPKMDAPVEPEWSHSLSYAGAESDFYTNTVNVNCPADASWMKSPWSESLSFASPETDFCAAQPIAAAASALPELPRTLAEILLADQNVGNKFRNQAIVVTTAEAPHRIVHVNHAWENLCGYTRQESLHQPLGLLLQKDVETMQRARRMVQQLQATHTPTQTILHNYTKSGRPFFNRVTIGELYLETKDAPASLSPFKTAVTAPSPDVVQFLVGILQEISPEEAQLDLAAA